ncbi:hypothetical protein CP99DC5_1163, partial [Chlamydia psittaci 99DC5]
NNHAHLHYNSYPRLPNSPNHRHLY